MTAGVAVFDASPLIAFHQVGELLLAKALFRQVLVPPVVALEVAPSLGALPTWIEVGEVVAIPSMGRMLDAGERAAGETP